MIKNLSEISVAFFVAVLLPILFVVSSIAHAEEIKCSTGAYVIDPDPNGLNVRDKPNGKVITRLPLDAMVTITAFKDGWIKISEADYPDNEGFAKKNHHPCKDGWTKLTGINGWVFAKHLGTSVRNYNPDKEEWLLSENLPTGQKTVKLEDTNAGVIVLECSGNWLKVIYRSNTGWLHPDLNCPNSLTTCN